MTQSKNRYKAKIGGKVFTIIGLENKVHMDIVTELANKQLAAINEIAPETTLENASILLAVNALSDQLKKEQQMIKNEVELNKVKAELEEMKAKTERLVDVEKRLAHYVKLENEAKEVLVKQGMADEEAMKQLSPNEAQALMNKQVQEKIKKNATELNADTPMGE